MKIYEKDRIIRKNKEKKKKERKKERRKIIIKR
jgi:hypothetical protein